MRITLTLLGTLTIVAAGFGQPGGGFTRARTPERSELDRAQLKMAWSIGLPVEGTRDGIATLQLIPVPDPLKKGAETVLLVVQMRSGTLAVYQAETGRRLWSKQPPPAYPVSIPEVAYDPRGGLIVVRDLNMYRYDLYQTQAAASATDESDNRLAVLPTMPTTAPTVVVADPTKRDEGVIVVCFNGNKLAVYGKAVEVRSVKPDTSVLKWKVHYEDDNARFKPGDNKAPSITVSRSVFGPDYGLAHPPTEPEPPSASVTMIRNLSRPNEFSSNIATTPSITIVDKLSRLGEYSRRDVAGPILDATSRRGDDLDFRLGQTLPVIRTIAADAYGRNGVVTKIIAVGTERDVQIDTVNERIGLVPEKKIGRDLLRTGLSAPASFQGSMMYVPTQDGTVYAIDAEFGLVAWSMALQSVPSQRPAIVDKHLFVTGRSGKLFRLNIDDGNIAAGGGFDRDGSFPGITAKQFLAASDRHVYATDRTNHLVVLDRQRGSVQGSIDITGFTTTLLNDTTDRVILGSHDGKLICLYDASSPTPKLYRTNALPTPPPPPAAAPADKPMEGEKPADKPAPKPADKPADKPAKPADKPADKPAAKPGDKPAAKPGDKPADDKGKEEKKDEKKDK